MRANTSLGGRRGGLTFGLCCLLMTVLCLTTFATLVLWAQIEVKGGIAGRITDDRGQPQRLLVHLLAQGDVPVGDVYTDSNGLFAFSALPNGLYHVVVEAQGYRPVRQSVVMEVQLNPHVQVNVALERAEKEPRPPGQIIVGSVTSHELNVKKLARPFDSKALREFEKGNEKQREGNFQSAVAHYQKALRFEPDFYPALNNLGAIYLRQKDHAQAKAAFVKSMQVNPDDGESYINLGHVLYEEAKYQQAVDRLDEGLKRSPRSPVGHFFLGCALMKLGDLPKAEASLKEAYTLDPARMASARLQLANLYLRRRDMAAASTELESYLQANPSDPQAPAIKKMLANIKDHRTN